MAHRTDFTEYTKDMIQEKVNQVSSRMKGCGYLDHQTRAIEQLFIEDAQADVDREIKELSELKGKMPKEELLKRINDLKSKRTKIDFSIIKVPKKDVHKFSGFGYFHDNGYQIIYADGELTHLEKRLIIAHELGHLLLHYKENRDLKGNPKLLKERLLEVQAHCFAKLAILNRSNFYKNHEELKNNYIFKDETVDSCIVKHYKEYDEDILAKG